MIHLSVAIGRFVEALFWGIFRVAGGIAALVVGGAIIVIALIAVGSRAFRKRG